MKIALASDHTGFEQLKDLKGFLESLGHSCVDFGPQNFSPGDDYPDFIHPAAEAVGKGECEAGIILGGSGQGEAITANRVRGVRCAVFYGPAVPLRTVDISGRQSRDPYEIVRLSREHNNANVLSIGVRFVSLNDMKQVINLWLQTPFSKDPRHARRVSKIDNQEA